MKATVVQARERKATLEEGRLFGNMLSSMPLCFNLIGPLYDKSEFAALLAEVLDLPIASIVEATCEWAPPKETGLGDLTAFDAFVRFTSKDGSPGFLGIETKYTEPFSPREYDVETYRPFTEASDWFRPGASDALGGKATNQLWRNVLLAATLSARGTHGGGWSVVLYLSDDESLLRAKEALAPYLSRPEKVRWCSYEYLVAVARHHEGLQDWARWFQRRYLDLSPIGLS